jgi:hypothetical protein
MFATTRPVRRARTAAAALTVTAVIAGAAACGTSTALDDQPAAPAQRLGAPGATHSPTSADTAERQGQLREDYLYTPHGRPVPAP